MCNWERCSSCLFVLVKGVGGVWLEVGNVEWCEYELFLVVGIWLLGWKGC